MGVPKFPKLRFPWVCGAITLCVDLWSKWCLKQSCSPCRNLSNNMSHATCMQGNWGDSWLLMVENQFGSLTPNLFFYHNLCFKCPNESCDPILNIYAWRAFQWYKELFNPMVFDSCNYFLKIRESIRIPTPKVGVHLGVWRFNSPNLPYFQPPGSMKCDFRASLLVRTFISPCFGRKPKARVMTFYVCLIVPYYYQNNSTPKCLYYEN